MEEIQTSYQAYQAFMFVGVVFVGGLIFSRFLQFIGFYRIGILINLAAYLFAVVYGILFSGTRGQSF